MDKCDDSEMKSWTGRIRTELFIGLQPTSRECLSVRENSGRAIHGSTHPRFYLGLCVSLSRYRGKRDLALNPLKGHCLLPMPPKREFKNLRVWGGGSFWKQFWKLLGNLGCQHGQHDPNPMNETVRGHISKNCITLARGEDRCPVSSDEELCSNTSV